MRSMINKVGPPPTGILLSVPHSLANYMLRTYLERDYYHPLVRGSLLALCKALRQEE